jgi:hypothetical protein
MGKTKRRYNPRNPSFVRAGNSRVSIRQMGNSEHSWCVLVDEVVVMGNVPRSMAISKMKTLEAEISGDMR